MNPLGILILIFIVVLIFMILRYMFTDPYTIQNMQNGETATVIQASSLATNGSSTPSSNFAYSVWFYINDWNYRYGEQKVIFGRMGSASASGSGFTPGVNGLDPCPAVVLGDTENNLYISLSCFSGLDQEPIPTTTGTTTTTANTQVSTCIITNVPIQSWVNLTISIYGRTMDVYINGKLVKTWVLPGVANVNNAANVYVTPNGGFDGFTSKFQYYPNSLNPQQAWNIYTQGYSNWLAMFNTYQVQLSLIENGTTQNSITI
jgi:hypothetical protein